MASLYFIRPSGRGVMKGVDVLRGFYNGSDILTLFFVTKIWGGREFACGVHNAESELRS